MPLLYLHRGELWPVGADFGGPETAALQSALLACAVSGNLLALVYYKYLFSILSFLSIHQIVTIPFAI